MSVNILLFIGLGRENDFCEFDFNGGRTGDQKNH
jgi:hypothetical protein